MSPYPVGVKEFWVYTALRLLLFVASFGIVAGTWGALAEDAPIFPVLLVALLVSGVASYFLLNAQRAALAARVERRASAAVERMRTKEDDD